MWGQLLAGGQRRLRSTPVVSSAKLAARDSSCPTAQVAELRGAIARPRDRHRAELELDSRLRASTVRDCKPVLCKTGAGACKLPVAAMVTAAPAHLEAAVGPADDGHLLIEDAFEGVRSLCRPQRSSTRATFRRLSMAQGFGCMASTNRQQRATCARELSATMIRCPEAPIALKFTREGPAPCCEMAQGPLRRGGLRSLNPFFVVACLTRQSMPYHPLITTLVCKHAPDLARTAPCCSAEPRHATVAIAPGCLTALASDAHTPPAPSRPSPACRPRPITRPSPPRSNPHQRTCSVPSGQQAQQHTRSMTPGCRPASIMPRHTTHQASSAVKSSIT